MASTYTHDKPRWTKILGELGIEKPKGNNVFVGSKGILVAGFETFQLYPTKDFVDFKLQASTIPKSPGFHREWLNACRGGEAATCDFKYSGPLTESVLLANVAYRTGEFEWDAAALKASTPDAQDLIKQPYRSGWEV